MPANTRAKQLLAFKSGNICAFPGCSQELTDDGNNSPEPAIIGEAAHICGEKPGSPRYDASMTATERNAYSNLIYMCPTHHTIIDNHESDYPKEHLQTIKNQHEQSVRTTLLDKMSTVGFAELEFVTMHFTSTTAVSFAGDFTIVAPENKIRKNELTGPSMILIRSGLALSKDISDFLETVSQDDPDFPERLKSGFLEEYHKHRKEGVKGDELFEVMCHFSQRGKSSPSQKAAGVAVLVYLFEKCEVFEK